MSSIDDIASDALQFYAYGYCVAKLFATGAQYLPNECISAARDSHAVRAAGHGGNGKVTLAPV
jgi:hypothetical protein